MNKHRRKQIKDSIALLEMAEMSICSVCDEETNSMNNMPENFQDGERYSTMEETVDYLEDAIENIHGATEDLRRAMSG